MAFKPRTRPRFTAPVLQGLVSLFVGEMNLASLPAAERRNVERARTWVFEMAAYKGQLVPPALTGLARMTLETRGKVLRRRRPRRTAK